MLIKILQYIRDENNISDCSRNELPGRDIPSSGDPGKFWYFVRRKTSIRHEGMIFN